MERIMIYRVEIMIYSISGNRHDRVIEFNDYNKCIEKITRLISLPICKVLKATIYKYDSGDYTVINSITNVSYFGGTQ